MSKSYRRTRATVKQKTKRLTSKRLSKDLKLPKYVQEAVDIKKLNKLLKYKKYQKIYKDIKKTYDVSTLSYRELKKYGSTREDIINYYQRELDIITGEYEKRRHIQFIDNYAHSLSVSNQYSKEDIAKFIDTMNQYVGTKKFNQIVNEELPEIGLYYIQPEGVELERDFDIDTFLLNYQN